MAKSRKAHGGPATQAKTSLRSDRARASGAEGAPTGQPRAESAGRSGSKRPVLRFVLLFVLSIATFYALTATSPFQKRVFPSYLDLNAAASVAVLRLFGEKASASGKSVVSPRYSLTIQRGCDAIEPTAIFASAVLAFPAGIRARVVGVLVGTVVLAFINLVRIVSLYYAGIHVPRAFEILHVDVWQPVFILLALVLWVVWAQRTVRRKADSHDAA